MQDRNIYVVAGAAVLLLTWNVATTAYPVAMAKQAVQSLWQLRDVPGGHTRLQLLCDGRTRHHDGVQVQCYTRLNDYRVTGLLVLLPESAPTTGHPRLFTGAVIRHEGALPRVVQLPTDTDSIAIAQLLED